MAKLISSIIFLSCKNINIVVLSRYIYAMAAGKSPRNIFPLWVVSNAVFLEVSSIFDLCRVVFEFNYYICIYERKATQKLTVCSRCNLVYDSILQHQCSVDSSKLNLKFASRVFRNGEDGCEYIYFFIVFGIFENDVIFIYVKIIAKNIKFVNFLIKNEKRVK